VLTQGQDDGSETPTRSRQAIYPSDAFDVSSLGNVGENGVHKLAEVVGPEVVTGVESRAEETSDPQGKATLPLRI
jgi:hypothetical protein